MKDFKKLSRIEMKNVIGGEVDPGDCPDNACQTYDDCPGDETCHSKVCPKDKNYYYNYCM